MIGAGRIVDLSHAGAITPAEAEELLQARAELARWERWRRAGRVFRFVAGVAAVVVFYAVILTAGGQCGCGSSSTSSAPARTSPEQADLMPTPFCASVLFTNGQVRRGCAPTEELCIVDSEKIRQAGAIARIRWVGSCRRWP